MTIKIFVEYWKNKLLSDGIKIFPDDFLDDIETTFITIPAKSLILGSEFFGTYEVITTDGEIIAQAESYNEAKYFVYASRQRKSQIKFPVNKNYIALIVKNYELYIDKIISDISEDYRKSFKDQKELNPVSEILKTLNLVRY